MRGILGAGAYLPHYRLDRASISAFVGTGGGRGTRTVAAYDEDTTTMGFEAARLALKSAGDVAPDVLFFSTVTPAYVDKTNATTIHAALRLDESVPAFDFGGSQRSAAGALRTALAQQGTVVVIGADIRTGLPGGGDEAAGGDAASAIVIGDGDGVIAEYIGGASATEEFVDRWRSPGAERSKLWEERFGETRYLPLGERAFQAALKSADLSAEQVDRLIVTSMHGRAANALAGRLGVAGENVVDTRAATIGNTGAAHPGLLLTSEIESAGPGKVIALVVLADGADVLLFRTADAITDFEASRPLEQQIAGGAPVAYGKFLAWRGMLHVEPPRRPEPPRPSSSAAGRSLAWKYGFVGRADPDDGSPQMPPLPSGADAIPMADVPGTIVTYTIDHLVYSESPPVIFAIVDFDGGGRLPIELTDVAPDDVKSGGRVEMTFRKLFTSDDIRNYFWKGSTHSRSELMGSHGIRDRVAIVSVGCTKFGEHWDLGADDLMVQAVNETLNGVGLTKQDIDAYWLGTAQRSCGITLAKPLELMGKPVSRVENFCATGSEALRQASYAVASGAYDIAMAVGVEKVKDAGYQGLPATLPPNDGTARNLTAAAMYSMIAPAYCTKYGVSEAEMRGTLSHIASKNHFNGARNPRAQFRREVSKEQVEKAPKMAGTLGVFDCAGVVDGSAAAIVVRAEDAEKFTDKPLYIKALSLVAGNGSGLQDPNYDYTTFPEVVDSAEDVYRQAGITDPRSQIAMAEVHDCFTPTEMVLCEDLGFAERGTAWKEILAGTFDLDGDLPVNPDGGLKSFGHPVGASGLRMTFECWLQLRGEAPEQRRLGNDRKLALTHNLGGYPGEMVSFVSILGTERD